VEEAARCGEDCGWRAARQRKGEGRGMEGGDDRWGQPIRGIKKRRKGGGEVGCRGRGSWAGGPAGPE
jgi:hypothetical protein